MQLIQSITLTLCLSLLALSCNDNENTDSNNAINNYQEIKNEGQIIKKNITDTNQNSITYISKNIKSDEYPNQIHSYNIVKLYDQIKWNIYCICCDKKIEFLNKKMDNNSRDITFGMLNMMLSEFNKLDDTTLSIKFSYFRNDTVFNYDLIKKIPYYGALINLTDTTINTYWTYYGASMLTCLPKVDSSKCPRESWPEHPEALKYIREHKDELAPWFRQEAIKRGVIKE